MIFELADDWHEDPYRIEVKLRGDLPDEIRTMVVDWIGASLPAPRVTGRYVRTGTAPDGVPVYAWIPEERAT